ncbi:S1 domain-containing RNA-binding protein [uncultured Limosilactobacillus sp.]|uniref:S1 domain-containing RNA-binding protein n=1 Tax=uncultured Limosilactobacillus sp. TaxID=2837629 RepID=UPI0025DD7BD0|nr:S1 domain-containing RNA-binding protein [uncultured Limosilactobacillus sp.]
MAIEEGAKVTGKVSGITNFGAFIDLADHQTGLVHISQISNHYVKDIHDVLSIGDEVTVKVMKVADDGKIALSIKAAADQDSSRHHEPHGSHEPNHAHKYHASNDHHSERSENVEKKHYHSQGGFGGHHEKSHFDDMLASYMKESESRLSTLKRQTDGKRGGRGGRRS